MAGWTGVTSISIPASIGLVAHDEKKRQLLDWLEAHLGVLKDKSLYATGTTGRQINERFSELSPHCYCSGPRGGDQQLGAAITEGRLEALIFFVDPLSPHPHDVDVKALLRLAILYNIPFACNEASASLILRGMA